MTPAYAPDMLTKDLIRAGHARSLPVGYWELPGTGHGFDMLDGSPTATAAAAIRLLLNDIHEARQLATTAAV